MSKCVTAVSTKLAPPGDNFWLAHMWYWAYATHNTAAVGIASDICIHTQLSKDGKGKCKMSFCTCLCASVSDHLEPCRIRHCAHCQAGEIQRNRSLSQSPEASQMIDISQDHVCTQKFVTEMFAPCIIQSDVQCNLADKG